MLLFAKQFSVKGTRGNEVRGFPALLHRTLKKAKHTRLTFSPYQGRSEQGCDLKRDGLDVCVLFITFNSDLSYRSKAEQSLGSIWTSVGGKAENFPAAEVSAL